MEEKDAYQQAAWPLANTPTTKESLVSAKTPRIPVSRGLSEKGSVEVLKQQLPPRSQPAPIQDYIHPFETFLGLRLIHSIDTAEHLQPVIHRAAHLLQRNAKWFSEDDLENLVEHVIAKTSDSTSTADIDAALELVDDICTFAYLPRTCLKSVIRFISLAYHHGTQSRRHHTLAEKAWKLFHHILNSHLGPLSLETLLDVLASEETIWSRASFAVVAGALRLLEDKFALGQSHVVSTVTVSVSELLGSLKSVVREGDNNLKEQVITIMNKILASNNAVVEIRSLACWKDVIELVDNCEITSAGDIATRELLGRLTQYSFEVEPDEITILFRILVRADHAIPTELAQQVSAPLKLVKRMLGYDESTLHEQLLQIYSQSITYEDELFAFVQGDLEFLVCTEDNKEWALIIQRYIDLIMAKDVLKETDMTCASFLCALFHASMEQSFEATRTWKVTLTFNALVKIALSAPRPEARLSTLRMLARLRVAINGYVYLDEDDSLEGAIAAGTQPGYVLLSDLDRDAWLDGLLLLVQHPVVEENSMTAAFVLISLPQQLGNLPFFVDQKQLVREIYNTAITKLASATNATAAGYIRILTALINYRGLFSPSEERHMIDLFIKKAGSSESVSKDCIHALTICCHEIPESVARELDNVIQKMAQIITQKHLAIHVLEFLTGLSRLPNLFRNFRVDDYRKVFGVCISYLQSLRDGHASRQSGTASSDAGSSSHQATHEIMPQYVYALAHHVIVFWYILLRPDDRQPIKTYVSNSLSYLKDGDREVPDDQGLVVIDFMERMDNEHHAQSGLRAVTDAEPDEIFDEVDGRLLVQHRICGMVLVSTHTSLRTAKTLVTTRRPSGTAKYLVYGRFQPKRESTSTARFSAVPSSLWSGSANEDETMTIYSDDLDGSAYGSISVPGPSSPLGSSEIVTLPDEAGLERAIQMFDRTPGLDSHKAGVIYIGEDQTNEKDILANSSGSPDYREIVSNLGKLIELKGADFNTQGLDTKTGSDGKHVLVWNNEITELVFHVATMMPTDPNDAESSVIRKKSHIGNDFVSIVFNNSGLPFRFDTLPSAFNYVYIVITPSVRATFLQTRTHAMNTSNRNRFYRVELVTRDEFPAISSAAEPKMVSGASLPGYVRNLALNACVFSDVWVNRENEEYRSSWRTRLSQIRRLRDRYAGHWSQPRQSSALSKGSRRTK